MTLPLADVRACPDRFQFRASKDVDGAHVRSLARDMAANGQLEAVKVAKVGKAHYVVDGFHRRAAAERIGWSSIDVLAAKMSMGEARDFALLANTRNGKSLSRADKANIFEVYVADGKHRDEHGEVKPSRLIAAEMHVGYSHEAIRKKLKARGEEPRKEVEYPNGYSPYNPPGEPDEDYLAFELALEAERHLKDFGDVFFSLEDHHQRELLATARELLGRLERGERGEAEPGAPRGGWLNADDIDGGLDI